MKRGLVIAAACAIVMAVGSTAFAGEVTGSGVKIDQNQGKSWCSFSGLNDDPGAPLTGGPNGPGGTSQSYGQEVRLGLASPHELTPGIACNPVRTFLPRSTVTSRLQLSGQSSGHAVWTMEWPQERGGETFASAIPKFT